MTARRARWTIIFQIVGGTTMELNALKEGDYLPDFVGPLGKATHIEGLKKVAIVGGGVGCAIALPVAQGASMPRARRCIPSSASAARIWSFSRTSSTPAPTRCS